MTEKRPANPSRISIPGSLWTRFFILLLVVSAVSLSASLYLRHMMLSDFEQYLEGEMLDRVYQVAAGLEGGYEQWSGWNERQMGREVIRALMMGMVSKVSDSTGLEIMTSADAVEKLTPLMRRRVLSLVEMNTRTVVGEFVPYPLFLRGEQIGTLEILFVPRDRVGVFTERSGRFLTIAFLTMGGLAVLASFFVSRRLTNPLKRLEEQAGAIRQGDYSGRVDVEGGDEIGSLSRSFNEMAGELQVLEKLRRKVIANVAHELRTPIAVMRSELEGMVDGVIPADEGQLTSLQEEIARLTKILDGIDDLTQAQASSLSLDPRELELDGFLNDMVERLKGAPGSEGVDTVLDVATGTVAFADPDRLYQIVLNLLSNAFRATQAGGKVTVSAGAGDRGVYVKVADTGQGIDPEMLPHIFERFYRSAEGGLGLGLPIVRELVDAHGGEITVESEVGKGTVVMVTLPRESKVEGRK